MNITPAARRLFAALLDRWQPSAWYVLGGAAVLVGLLGGIGVWIFESMIHLVELGAHQFEEALQSIDIPFREVSRAPTNVPAKITHP